MQQAAELEYEMKRNDPSAIISELKRENAELTAKLQRAHWKNRNQRNEIKRLNAAILFRNNTIIKRDQTIDDIVQRNYALYAESNKD